MKKKKVKRTREEWIKWKTRMFRTSLNAVAKKRGIESVPMEVIKGWILENIDKPCQYCRVPLNQENFSLDHATPTFRGGLNTLENFRACCKGCNLAKGVMTEGEFLSLFFLIRGWEDRGKSLISRLKCNVFGRY